MESFPYTRHALRLQQAFLQDAVACIARPAAVFWDAEQTEKQNKTKETNLDTRTNV